MEPVIPLFVLYTLTEQDATMIASARAAQAFPAGVAGQHNPVHPGDTYPAVVVKTFENGAANLQVFLDGTDTYWATSRTEGDVGKWGHWAPAGV